MAAVAEFQTKTFHIIELKLCAFCLCAHENIFSNLRRPSLPMISNRTGLSILRRLVRAIFIL